MSGWVELTHEGHVAVVTLRHEAKFNAMTRLMWQQLQTIFEDLQTRQTVRAVVVRGADGHFCAGGDISEYAEFRFVEASLRAFHEEKVWGALAAMLACDVPLLASIDGNCMGAGMEIASCCDIRLASSLARFGAPIAKLGFPMAPKEAALVVRAAGELTAREMLLGAAVLDAGTMLRRGFLSHVHDAPVLAEETSRWALSMAKLAPQAARLNKQTFRQLDQPTSWPGAYAYADSAEHREGVTAFMEKRPPNF